MSKLTPKIQKNWKCKFLYNGLLISSSKETNFTFVPLLLRGAVLGHSLQERLTLRFHSPWKGKLRLIVLRIEVVKISWRYQFLHDRSLHSSIEMELQWTKTRAVVSQIRQMNKVHSSTFSFISLNNTSLTLSENVFNVKMWPRPQGYDALLAAFPNSCGRAGPSLRSCVIKFIKMYDSRELPQN